MLDFAKSAKLVMSVRELDTLIEPILILYRFTAEIMFKVWNISISLRISIKLFSLSRTARKSLETILPITRSDTDIEQLLQRAPKNLNTILDMFVAAKLPIHILRGVEPNLRFGVSIRNFIESISNMADIPQCMAPGDINNENADLNAQERWGESAMGSKRKCIHLASRKQIGDALIRYEDKSIVNK